jgi:hypothetical protein
LYERDIPEFPAIVDWYDGEVVAWVYQRTRDDTPEKVRAFEEMCEGEILDGLQLSGSKLHMKCRGRIKDRTEQ